MKYRVFKREVAVNPYEVEAVNKHEALAKVKKGEGILMDKDCLHQVAWTVEEKTDNS